MNERKNGLSFLDALSVLGVAVQLMDFDLNIKQTSNDELMSELQHQNKEYLEKIIANQKDILKKLSDLNDTRQ